jgi:hypothetical protein
MISDMQTRLGELEKSVAEKAPMNVIQPILNQLASDTGAVASSTSSTQRIARALMVGAGTMRADATVVRKGSTRKSE